VYTTDQYEGMLAETVTMHGHGGDAINAYLARPLGPGPFPGIVLIHHAPGWDELYREFTRRFAHHGYVAICPNLYFRDGHGTPEDVGARVRAAGGADDALVIGDVDGAIRFLRAQAYSSGRVGLFGTCSGGRHGFLAGCRLTGIDAVVECWGGNIVAAPEDLAPRRPVAPIDLTKDLAAPLLGIFGNDDRSPTPEQVDLHEAELRRLGKDYEFHRYDGAGHGFFYHDRPNYRAQQAIDGWKQVWAFLDARLRR
jgi:carboxymethylenebutenolidase